MNFNYMDAYKELRVKIRNLLTAQINHHTFPIMIDYISITDIRLFPIIDLKKYPIIHHYRKSVNRRLCTSQSQGK